MNKGQYITTILRAKQSVFSFKDISMLWREAGDEKSRVRLSYYVKRGQLYCPRRGFYAKDKNYNRYELATKIFVPAYVSFETVLAKEGVVFQSYGQIFVASYQTRDIVCDGETYSFRKIKNSVLTNAVGIENKDGVSIASKERAFLDTVYLNKDYYFDNLLNMDWKKIFEMVQLYENKRMEEAVKKYAQHDRT